MYNHFIRNIILPIAFLLPTGGIAQLQINPGATLVMNGPVNLVMNNSYFTNNGNFVAGNGTVWFTGNVIINNAYISGNNSISFNNVVINKRVNDVLLYRGIAVTGNLTMQKGNLLLNNNLLYLGTTGSIAGENNQSRITDGTLIALRSAKSALQGVNPGNMGLELTTAVSPGIVTVSRTNTAQMMPTGRKSIQRYFTVTATANNNLNAAVRMYYLDAELAGNYEPALTLWQGSDLANTWLPIGKDNSDTAANWVLKTGIDHFTRYTLFDSSAVVVIGEPTDTLVYTPPGNEYARIGTHKQTQVYPNPVQDHFTLVFFSDQQKTGVISLYDQMGNLIQYKKINYQPGMNRVTWNMSGYAAGVYFLSFNGIGNQKKYKIIKE
jgi:hypothetical protein